MTSRPTPKNTEDPSPVHAMAVNHHRYQAGQRRPAAGPALPHQHANVKKTSKVYVTLHDLDASKRLYQGKAHHVPFAALFRGPIT